MEVEEENIDNTNTEYDILETLSIIIILSKIRELNRVCYMNGKE